jgi:merozoite surface protein 3 (MSP3), putative
MNGANITDLKHQVSEEQTFFLTLVEPYNNVDDLFFSLFKAFPLAVVPTEPEALIEFKSKLEELLNFAEMQDVDVLVQDRNAYQSFRVKSLEDFDYATQYVEHTDKEVTPELPDMGNFWSIANEPFEVNFNAVYDNILDPIDQRFTARGDLLPQGQIDLPDSTFDQRHRLGSNNQSELRIVDRLSKYGESFPFLNENGQLSDSARAEFEELLMSEATDEDLLTFLDKGIDAVKGAGNLAKDAIEGAINIGKKIGDAAGLTVDGKRAKAEKEQAKLDAERSKAEREKVKEQAKTDKIKAENDKEAAKEAIKDATDEVKEVSAEKVAKAQIAGEDPEKNKDLQQKAEAFSHAEEAKKQAIKAGVNPRKATNAKAEKTAEIDQAKKEIKEKEKSE